MDIRPPKHPIHSLRAFVIEIFTVTCGIVIALGLESIIVARHDRQLADQARQEFRAEIKVECEKLKTLMAGGAAERTMIERLLQYGSDRLAHHTLMSLQNLDTARSFRLLPADAWQTALATQAIGQLSFDEVRALSTLNDGVVAFNDFEARARDQWVGIAAFGDPAQLSDDEVRQALQAIRVAFAYQQSLTTLAADVLKRALAADKAVHAT